MSARRTAVQMPRIGAAESAVDALGVGDEVAPTGVVRLLSAGEAQRLTQQIKLTASGVRNGLFKLRNLIDEAKRSNVWSVLGFASWTAYLVDALGDEPLRVSREERVELVGYLAGEGLSRPAIAAVTGVTERTVIRDARELESAQGMTSVTPSKTGAGRVPDEPATVPVEASPEPTRVVTGLDGKTYNVPAAQAPRRRAITDQARDAGWDARKVAERLQRLRDDDRLSRNKEEVAAQLRGHLTFVIETCQGFLDDLNQSQED